MDKMTLKQLFAFLGIKRVEDIFANFMNGNEVNDIILHHFDALIGIIADKKYSTETVLRFSSYDDRKTAHPTYLLNETEDYRGFASATSALSALLRLKSSNMNKVVPIKNLTKQFVRVMKDIYTSVCECAPESSTQDEIMQNIKANLVSYILQYYHERRLLVNSFQPSRVFILLNKQIKSVEALIADHAPVSEIIKCVAFIDPFAGWGCRLTAALAMCFYIRDLMVMSDNYSDDEINEYNNGTFYVGIDINPETAAIYKRLLDVICPEYAINPNGFKCFIADILSYQASDILASFKQIEIVLTSSPTMLEVYPGGYSDVLARTGITRLGNNTFKCGGWRTWVEQFLIAFIEQIRRHTNVKLIINVIDNCKVTEFSDNGKSNFKMVHVKLVDYMISLVKTMDRLYSDVRTEYLAWPEMSPVKNCDDCENNSYADCGECSSCKKSYGCPNRINACSVCKNTAQLRTVVSIEVR